jgi:hypothetical protein
MYNENIFSRARRVVLEGLKKLTIWYNNYRHCGFPDIHAFRNVVKEVKRQAKYLQEPLPTIEYLGTVKIHGTNMSVSRRPGGRMWVQSRNQIVTKFDHPAVSMGFYDYVSQYQGTFESLLKAFETEESLEPYGKNTITTVYGEWAGRTVMGKSAVAQLEPFFMVLGVSKYLGTCSDDEELRKSQIDVDVKKVSRIFEWWDITYGQIFNKGLPRIFCIYDFATYHVSVDFSKPEDVQLQLVNYLQEVEKCCPVAYTLSKGSVKGVGEGIVWEPYDKSVPQWLRKRRNELVFKVKGAAHMPTNNSLKVMTAPDPEKLASIHDFIKNTVTENRLQQGLVILQQQGLAHSFKNTSAFIKWVCNDILKEERDVLEASNLDEKEAMRYASREAMEWFKKGATK